MAKDSQSSNWASIISAVKSPLGFFALVILVSEVILAIMAQKASGMDFTLLLVSMILIIFMLVGIVAVRAKNLVPVPGGAEMPLRPFCKNLSGYWWERITPGSSALSILEIRPDAATGTVALNGRAYQVDGSPAAVWESQAVCIHEQSNKLFYYWRGWQAGRPSEPYEGFGEFTFSGPAEQLNRGVGVFSDSNLNQMEKTTRKAADLVRCTPEEVERIQHGSDQEITRLVTKKLLSLDG